MSDPVVPPLLALPREIRDMIIDDVLISQRAAPAPKSQKVSPEEYPERRSIETPRPVPPLPASARVNAQLRAETLQRAAAIQTPLVLDVLVLENGSLKCTWIQRPCQETTKWQKIDMKVQVRTQPVVHKSWQALPPNAWTPSQLEYRSLSSWIANDLSLLIVMAISQAMLGVLWADLPGMEGRPHNVTHDPINSIEECEIQVSPARDEFGEIVREEFPCTGPCYDASEHPDQLTEDLGARIRLEWSEGEYTDSFIYISVNDYETDLQPLVTNVGAVKIRTTREDGQKHLKGVGFIEELQWSTNTFSTSKWIEIVQARERNGWQMPIVDGA